VPPSISEMDINVNYLKAKFKETGNEIAKVQSQQVGALMNF